MNQVVKKTLGALASLKFSVVIFALAIFLIFAGTLAQQYKGNWTIVNEYFRSFGVFIPLKLFAPTGLLYIPGYLPFPGGFTLGALLLVNVLAAYATRLKITWKRIGLLMLHAGIILLIVGEVITHYYADDANMTIDEGSYANFAVDTRQVELAVIDPSDPDTDQVVVIPQNILRKHDKGKTIQDPRLPFQVTVISWMDNSTAIDLTRAGAMKLGVNPASAGVGLEVMALPEKLVTGVENKRNMPSAYISLRGNDAELGRYLVTTFLPSRQSIDIDGKRWEIALRFRRNYKPYTIHLLEFRHDKFVGTEMARNFSSRVRLVDSVHGVDREALIYMNHPLRHEGETFYQHAFLAGDSGTVLQVVRNPGWTLPYISCVLVSAGMIMHFVIMLIRFVGRTI